MRRKNVNILDDIEIQDSIRETFIKLDENLAFELAKRKMYECGTTVVCAIITDEKIILANCGTYNNICFIMIWNDTKKTMQPSRYF